VPLKSLLEYIVAGALEIFVPVFMIDNKHEVVQKYSARLTGGCTLLSISPISKFFTNQNLIYIKQCHFDFFLSFTLPHRSCWTPGGLLQSRAKLFSELKTKGSK
jgi:hypothetical protein